MEQVEAVNGTPAGAARSRPKRRRWLVGVALVLLVAAVTVYAARRHIGEAMGRELSSRLSAMGYHVDWDSAAWVPGPGVRLKNVALYRDAARTAPLFRASEVSVTKGTAGWRDWSVARTLTQGARLALGTGEDELVLDDADLDLLISRNGIVFTACQAESMGLRMRVRGSVPFPPQAEEGGRSEEAAAKEAPPGEALQKLDLGWVRTVKRWATVQAEGDPPVVELELTPIEKEGATHLGLLANLAGEKFNWMGRPWRSASVEVRMEMGGPPDLFIDRLVVRGAEGVADLKGRWDGKDSRLIVERLHSELDALALVRSLAPETRPSLEGLYSKGLWNLGGSGEFHFGGDSVRQSQWEGSVALAGELGYARDTTRLALGNPSGTLALRDGVISSNDLAATFCGGDLRFSSLAVALPVGAKPGSYRMKASLNQAGLDALVRSFRQGDRMPGALDFTWQGGGGFTLGEMSGSGTLSVREARFYSIPLLGPLHLVMDRLKPGFGRDVASKMTTQLSLKENVLSIRELSLDSSTTRVTAGGDLDLAQRTAQLQARANVRGLVGVATQALSQLLEFEGMGPLDDIQWRLKAVPKELSPAAAAKLIGDTGGAVLEVGTGVAKDAVKSVPKIIEKPLKLLPLKKRRDQDTR